MINEIALDNLHCQVICPFKDTSGKKIPPNIEEFFSYLPGSRLLATADALYTFACLPALEDVMK